MSLWPRGEAFRRAIRWIAERRQEAPDTPVAQLVDEVARRFDLSPLDQDFLWRALAKGLDEPPDEDGQP